jgi:UDP-GlcNAc:undecaprenyl-phosphate/decaprenyl-phosphate GlcNAc-1-phosphate transferase
MFSDTMIWAAVIWGVCLATSLFLTRAVRAWAIRKKLLDRAIQFHTTHSIAVPRIGGLALAITFVLLFVWIEVLESVKNWAAPEHTLVILFSCLGMFALGFSDDLRPLGAKKKLAVQILIAFGAYLGGLQIGSWTEPFTNTVITLGYWDAPLTILWLVGITNLINLVDGIDGLAAGIALLLMILIAVLSGVSDNNFSLLLAVGMHAALLGFLYYNFPPAKIFLGDGGAYFLGMLIAQLALVNASKGEVAVALMVPFFALGLPIIDTCFSIVRRGLQGLPIFRADRRHIHHRLIAMGHSHQRVVLVLYGISVFFAVLALGMFISRGQWMPLLIGVFMIVMVISARLFGFVHDWYKLGRLLTNAIVRRKHTKYALLWNEILFLEAETVKSLDELWESFGLQLERLGFHKASLTSTRGNREWSSSKVVSSEVELSAAQELRGNVPAKIEFRRGAKQVDEDTFFLLSELSAEAWGRATARYFELHPET